MLQSYVYKIPSPYIHIAIIIITIITITIIIIIIISLGLAWWSIPIGIITLTHSIPPCFVSMGLFDCGHVFAPVYPSLLRGGLGKGEGGGGMGEGGREKQGRESCCIIVQSKISILPKGLLSCLERLIDTLVSFLIHLIRSGCHGIALRDPIQMKPKCL